MKYQIRHTTQYQYSQMVGQCHSEARLYPRTHAAQQCLSSHLHINPPYSEYREHEDYFGNRVAYFAVQQPHRELSVTALSEVSVQALDYQADLFAASSWEEVRRQIQTPQTTASSGTEQHLSAILYQLDSEMISVNEKLKKYAAPSFLPDRSIYEVAEDITRRIYQDFIYDPDFTTIATPLSTVLAHKRGVCQDFAHLAIACMRSFGLPARYVSGYIETTPPPGVIKLAGSDASHAWFSVFQPGCGWLDFDPTNNCKTAEQHITLAWGRDYHDVTPFKGLAVGGGEHTVSVAVDVLRQQ